MSSRQAPLAGDALVRRRFALTAAVLLILWAVAAVWVVPALIRDAYAGESLPLFNRLISAQERVALDSYLAVWSSLASALTVGLVLAAVTGYLIVPRGEPRSPADILARGEAARQVLWLMLWWALVAGGLHAVVVGVRYRLLGQFTWQSRDVVWMSPLGTLLILSVIGVPLAAALWLRPRRRLRLVAFSAVSILGALAVMLLLPRIYFIALLVLATGWGMRLAAAVAERPERWFPLVRRSAIALALVIGVLGLGRRVWQPLGERRALAALKPAPPGAPNVLVIILDTVRASSLGLYGYHRPTTPELEKFARDATTFDYAFAPAPWTLPSHASMFTGLPSRQLGARRRVPLDGRRETLAEAMAKRGYATSAFTANFLYTSHESGLDRGFVHYADHRVSLRQIIASGLLGQLEPVKGLIDVRSPGALVKLMRRAKWQLRPQPMSDPKPAAMVVNEFLAWVETHDRQPFFSFLNIFDAHEPYQPPPPWRTRFAPEGKDQDAYDGSIAYIDNELGRLFSVLEGRGLLNRTVVVVTSDHGEQFGEHGLYTHSNSLYMPLLHVPLIVRFPPQVPVDRRRADPVSLRDLPASILDLTGMSAASPFPGRSLRMSWTASAGSASLSVLAQVERNPEAASHEPVARGALTALIQGHLHYVRHADGQEELFDYRADPGELVNLAQRAEWSEKIESFRQQVASETTPPMHRN